MTVTHTRKTVAVSFFAAILSVSLASGAYAAGAHGGGHGQGPSIGEAGKAAEATRTIEITMRDNSFEPENIAVARGETIRFVIVNKGEFAHEFNLGTAAMHVGHQKEMMMMMEHGILEADKINHDRMKMDMGGGKTMEHNDPNSALLEPGKSAEMVWTFSADADLEFACNVPGHYESGMVGKIETRHGAKGTGS